jgi:hypothetical protein
VRKSLGGYRVHNAGSATVSFANSEQINKAPEAFNLRWAILRKVARARLQVELPPTFHDFAREKARFCSGLYHATLSNRWRWMMRDSRHYLHTIVANPLLLSSLCLMPCSPLSDLVVRYIASPLARRRTAER